MMVMMTISLPCMYSWTNKQKICILTNERLVNHHFLTSCKTSSGSNPNYNTAIFTSTSKEKQRDNGNCSPSNECIWSDQYFCEPLLKYISSRGWPQLAAMHERVKKNRRVLTLQVNESLRIMQQSKKNVKTMTIVAYKIVAILSF